MSSFPKMNVSIPFHNVAELAEVAQIDVTLYASIQVPPWAKLKSWQKWKVAKALVPGYLKEGTQRP